MVVPVCRPQRQPWLRYKHRWRRRTELWLHLSRLVILRPMRNWLWPYPEVSSSTPRGPVGTPSSVPVATAPRPTHPAALKTQYHHKSQTTTISRWPGIRSLSSCILTLTSPPPSPETVTSVSPTDSCSRASGRPPQPACPAHRLITMGRGPTLQGPTPPHPSTPGLIRQPPQERFQVRDYFLDPAPIMPLAHILRATVLSSSPLGLPRSAAPPLQNPPAVGQAPGEQAPFLFVRLSSQ